MIEFKDHKEAFDKGVALPRLGFGPDQEWVYYHMIYTASDEGLPLWRGKVGGAEMKMVNIENVIAKAKSAKLNENMQSRVDTINML